MVKNIPATAGNARNVGLISGSGKFPEVGNGSPLQYACLENSMDMRSLAGYSPWVAKSRT